MLQTVDVGERALDGYRGIAPDRLLDDLVATAQPLRGKRCVHVSATPYGGGVSELLRSVVPLMNDLGLLTDWKIITGDEAFFRATKRLHNALQGAPESPTPEERRVYLENAERNAELFEERYDFVFIHDPQPAAMLHFLGKSKARWIWRCHIDTSNPNPEAWGFLRPYLTRYDATVFTLREFVPPGFLPARLDVVPPAIDPLSPKNLSLPPSLAKQILAWNGIRLGWPLVTQVARFDPWKDPLGVIEAYRIARETHPRLQLALVGSMALDDPEAWEIYEEVRREVEQDPLIHVFQNLGNTEVNAFQMLSDVVVQKSLREGFGLVVSEALWKGTPVVAGRAGGIPLQMADGAGGILVDSIEACARALVQLLDDPERAEALGRRGRERAREYFLLPRLLLNHVSILRGLSEGAPPGPAPAGPGVNRDPVCGMIVEEPDLAESINGESYVFCSEQCRNRFRLEPQRYVRIRNVMQPGTGSP